MTFTAESELVTFHVPESAPRKQTILLDNVPDTFDWRLHAHIAALPYHPCSVASLAPSLVMAVQCLQDRWAIWHNLDVTPPLSVPYIANVALACGVDVTNVKNAWFMLHQHGTVDTRKDGYRVRNVYKLAPTVENIRRDIYNHGPVTSELQIDDHFETYCTTLEQLSTQTRDRTLNTTAPPSAPIYNPPLDETTTGKTLTVTIIGWGQGRHSSEPDFWIVGTPRGARSFAKRNDYGVNGYMLVAANGQLEQHCMAAFPFFSYIGVKQPPCCQFAFQAHSKINVHGPIHAVVYRGITVKSSTPLPAPVTLKSGKRCKRPSQFHAVIEVQKDALHTYGSFNKPSQAWAREFAGEFAGEFASNKPPNKRNLPQQLSPTHKFMKWCVDQPGEIIAIFLLIVGCVLACVACSMI